MTDVEYNVILDRLKISQRRLSRLLGCDKATTNRWAQGLAPIPGAVHLLLVILDTTDLTIDDLERILAEEA